MTPAETLDHLRALTDPTPEQLREASDLALMARGWRTELRVGASYHTWIAPDRSEPYRRPHPCASIDDAIKWMVPEGCFWGRKRDTRFWVHNPKTDKTFWSPANNDERLALMLTIAGLAARLENGK